PIEIRVTNLNDYYLSTTLTLTKAPELIEKNFKEVLLKPKESKSYYFIGKLQSNLSQDYEYTGTIDSKESFGSTSFSNILIRKEYPVFSLKNVKESIDRLNDRESKNISQSLNLNCSTEKKVYYSDEEIQINCNVKNNGNSFLFNVNVCFKNKCETTDLRINEDKNFKFAAINQEKIAVFAETREIVARKDLSIEIIEIPDLFISGLSPSSVNYDDNVNLSFTLNSEFKAYNVTIRVNDVVYDIKYVYGEKDVTLKIKGKDLVYGLKIDAEYYDERGNKYTKEFNFDVNVEKIPWYKRLIKFIVFFK
ncbi:MAG: hypothetical protein AABY22_19065, partial [Nanoarchaeota archaeon]